MHIGSMSLSYIAPADALWALVQVGVALFFPVLLFSYLSFRVLRGKGTAAFLRASAYAVASVLLALAPIRCIAALRDSRPDDPATAFICTGVLLFCGALLGVWRGPKGRRPFPKGAVCLLLLIVFSPWVSTEVLFTFVWNIR